jgi:hypothetical protein
MAASNAVRTSFVQLPPHLAAETTTMAASAFPRASPLRRRRWPLALEDQLIHRHGFACILSL